MRRSRENRVPNSSTSRVLEEGPGWSVLVDVNDWTTGYLGQQASFSAGEFRIHINSYRVARYPDYQDPR